MIKFLINKLSKPSFQDWAVYLVYLGVYALVFLTCPWYVIVLLLIADFALSLFLIKKIAEHQNDPIVKLDTDCFESRWAKILANLEDLNKSK